MKKNFLLCLLIAISALFSPLPILAVTNPLAERLDGRILLQVESYGRAWYVSPTDKTRYYLKDGPMAYEIMRTLGLGITNSDLAKIPASADTPQKSALAERLAGRILLQVENRGEAWYVNPTDKRRYYLKDGEAAYALMKKFALGVSNANLRAIAVNSAQIVHDTAFDDVAYALMRGDKIIAGKNINQILPPASMSKLMTALVLLDQTTFNWGGEVVISQAHLDYPKFLVGDDKTSEVSLRVNDVISAYDLWIAMLTASSNQATIALVDSSGLPRSDFIAAMNQKAQSLELTRTKFYDPTGLDAHNVTTPKEMAIIAKAAFDKPEILTAVKKGGYIITTLNAPPRDINVPDNIISLQSYQPDAAKLGFLVEAQRCVAMKKGDDVIVVMHARSMSERNKVITELLKK